MKKTKTNGLKVIEINEKDLKPEAKDALENLINASLMPEYENLMNATKQWHANTFADAKMGEQLLKLEEELKEVDNAKDIEERLKEVADVLIVCAGLRRYNTIIGNLLEKRLFVEAPAYVKVELLHLVEQKMDINRARKWVKLPDGRYKHTSKKSVDNKKKG